MENRSEAGEEQPGPDANGVPMDRTPEEVGLLDLLEGILRHRKTVWAIGLSVAIIAGCIALVAPRTWSTKASFIPQIRGEAGQSGLASLAGQFGVNIPTGEAGRSPEFYSAVISSQAVLDAVAVDTYSVADTVGLLQRGHVEGTIADILRIDEGAARLDNELAKDWLREVALTVTTDIETGLVEVEVTTKWPELSEQIAGRTLELVNEFNLKTRQAEAKAERRFVQSRVENARRELREAEGQLQVFLRNNRAFQASPELMFDHDRLQRNVALKQQVYSSLVQSYEQARISEVRNTPVIRVIERPQPPPLPNPRRTLRKIVVGLLLGSTFGVFVAIVQESLWRQKALRTDHYDEMARLWAEAKRDLKQPWSWLARVRLKKPNVLI